MSHTRISQSLSTKNSLPDILKEISLNEIIMQCLLNNSKKRPISRVAFEFAEMVILRSYLDGMRKDNFCIDLTKSADDNIYQIERWTKEQCRAFGKLYAAFSDQAASLLKQKQEQKSATANDVQLLWLKLPKQRDNNRKNVNEIKKYVENNRYVDNTGNENWISLHRFINTEKPDPIVHYKRKAESVSVVIITDSNKVLLLQRGGGSGRKGSFGTLTGTLERNESLINAVIREVHEEINCLVVDKTAHYLGTVHTVNLGADLAIKGQTVSFVDDDSYVYGILIPETELINTIKLDNENSQWRLFTREELHKQFATCHNASVHGNEVDASEKHVALAKSLLALDYAKDNFNAIQVNKINYPYTNSPGFFVKASHHLENTDNNNPIKIIKFG